MTACANRRNTLVAVAAVAAGLAAAGIAQAQNAPLVLQPPVPLPLEQPVAAEEEPAPPPDATPADGAQAPPPQAAPQRPDLPLRPMAEVEVGTLEEPDANAVGILDENTGGFGVALWDGSSAAAVAKLLPLLPKRTYSRPARDLMERLLLSAAAAPAGQAAETALLRQRVEHLAAIGALEEALALLEAVPKPAMTTGLRRLKAEVALMLGRDGEACALGEAMVRDQDAPFWSKLRVFCHLVAGRHGEAGLGAALLRELGHEDPPFFLLVEAAQDLPVPELESLPQPTPLHLALLRLTERPLPPDALRDAPAAVLRAVALGLPAPERARLVAAEEAERLAAVPAQVLARIYALVRPDPEVRQASAEELVTRGDPMARALLYQKARAARTPEQVLAAVADGLTAGRAARRPLQAARIYAPLVMDLKPRPELGGHAGLAARVLLMAGEIEAARPWAELAVRNGDHGLQAVVMLAEGQGGDDGVPLLKPDEERRMADLLAKLDGQPAAALLLVLADALDYALPEEAWLRHLHGPTVAPAMVPTPVVWQRLGQSAGDLRLGETVVLALLALDGVEPAAVPPLTLHRVVASLRLVGLEHEARALAVEAALAHGI